jgi:hypothetical protein
MTQKVIIKENFLDEKDLRYIENSIDTSIIKDHEFIDKFGIFKGEKVSLQRWVDNSSHIATNILKKFQELDKTTTHMIDAVQVLVAYKPYDVHSDFYTTEDQKIINDITKELYPSYTVIIPLTNFSQTIIFNQEGEYNSFSDYKNSNNTLKDHVSNNDWETFLSHCHKEDQEYLNINTIFHWKRGDMLAFDRKLFHASSNFNGIKKAIVLWLFEKTVK